MKTTFTRLTLALVCILISAYTFAQSPQAIPYQGIARDLSGNELINQGISLRFSIRATTAAGPIEYQETHNLVTNSLGLINLNIGQGTPSSGTFSSITWSSDSKFLQVEMDPAGGTSYIDMGTTQMMSVPYALHAETANVPGVPGPPGADGAQGPPGPAGSANINGTTNFVTKFTGTTTGGNSLIFDNGTNIGIGNTTPSFPLHINSANFSRTFFAVNSTATGTGVWGQNTSASGTGGGAGVVGISNQSGTLAAGVYGENPNAGGTGVIGIANNTNILTLPNGSGGGFQGLTTGVYARSSTAGSGQGLYADQFGAVVRVAYWSGTQFFKINGTGTVSTVVPDGAGGKVTMYAPESPEVLFTDYGQGQLINGRAHIEIDPLFALNVTINEKHPLRVFIQLEGECNGVYVTNKSERGFDVIELGGGKSNVNFQWNIVCNRADEDLGNGRISRYADARFEKANPNERTEVSNDTRFKE